MIQNSDWWKKLKIGDTVTFSWNEFDGSGSVTGKVEEIGSDHVIVEVGGMHLWLDNKNEGMFCRENYTSKSLGREV